MIRKAVFILVSVMSLVSGSALAQDSLLRKSDLSRFTDASIYTFARPLRWKAKDVTKLGILLGATAAITLLDEPVRELFKKNESTVPEEVEVIGYHFGKPYAAFAVTGTFYLAGLAFKNKWSKETGIHLGVTLLTSGLLQTLSKDLIGRARPGTEQGPYFFKSFSGKAAYHSFLSGHVSVAYGISLVIGSRVNNLPVRILFYSLAASTAVSRMHTDAHWLSDIAFGAALAWFCNQTASRRLAETRNGIPKRDLPKVAWQIMPGPNGLSLVARF